MLWISHRGVHDHHLENSKAAFDEACRLGFGCLETDLRVTADGVIVLCHDRDLFRLFGQKKILVDQSNWDDIKCLTNKDGQGILRLTDFLEFYESRSVSYIFDIKPETAYQVLENLAKDTRLPGLLTKVRFLFWHQDHQKAFQKELKAISILASESKCWQAGLFALLGLGRFVIEPNVTYSLPPRFLGLSLFNPKMVSRFHRRNAKLLAYLPGSRDDINEASAAGFDEILSDFLHEIKI